MLKLESVIERVSQVKELPGKKWFAKLDEAVIEAGRCVECGGCIAACPSGSIGVAPDGRPTLVKMCTGCSRCWDFCPRAGLRYERLWGLNNGAVKLRAAYTAKARDGRKATNGGAVTALLQALIEKGVVEGALVAKESREQPWKGEAYLATRGEDLRGNAKTFYNQVMTLRELNSLEKRVAFVGTPCQIQALKALQKNPWQGSADWRADSVKLTIALMCTRAFKYEKFASRLKKRGVELGKVKSIEVKSGELILGGEGIAYRGSVRDLDEAALAGCDECADFSGKLADISVGSIASESGYSTVLIRTSAGEKAWEAARDSLEHAPLKDLNAVTEVEAKKLNRAKKFLKRSFDPGGDINIEVEEHYSAYSSERAPQPLNPARVFSYKEVC